MANIDLRVAPYYQTSKDIDYTQLLFRPGMHLQNQELNELQDREKRIIKDIADALLKDGDIISGAQIIINEKLVTVTDGKIYVQGIVRHYKQQTVTITAIGQEVIGVKLKKSISDPNEDKTILSPAEGFENYGLAGADRLKETLILTVNDPDAIPLYILIDGNLVNDTKNEDGNWLDRFLAILARRTYDESGHYKVYGNELAQKAQYDNNFLYLTMSEGKSYVRGWEIDKKAATTIPIEKAISTRSIKVEPKVYVSGTSKYKLNNSPVAHIERLSAEVQVATNLTRQGAVNGADPIPARYSPVVDIKKIEQVSSSIVYIKNVDYVLENDTVRWLAGGRQPELGATYDITFTYNKVMLPDIDYALTSEGGEYFVELLSDGDKPVANTQMQVDYNFYLHYVASITMDRNGILRVIKGQPDIKANVRPPDISDQYVLLMGYARVAPFDDTLAVFNSNTVRLSMIQLQKMFERLEDMELNQAITDLDEEALTGEDPTQLKGIFTDGFIGWSKADVNHSEFNAAINPIGRYLTLGFSQEVNELTLDVTKADQYNKYDRLVTGKSTEYIHDKQPYGTKSHLINPYTDYTDAMKPYHNIVVVPISGATITTTPARQAKEGEIVTVNVNVTGTNLEFKEILIDGAYMTGNSFTMPNHHVTVTAVLKDTTPIPPPKHNITIIPVADANITTIPAYEATEGTVVKINVKELTKDIILKTILVNGEAISADSFTMPNHHVTVTATMEDIAPKFPPTIKITPAVDNWVDEQNVVIPRDGGTRVVTSNIDSKGGGQIGDTRWWQIDSSSEKTETSTSVSTSVLDTAIEFMRVKPIKVVSERFKPYQDDIIIRFNDVRVAVTPESETYRGAKAGYLKADSNGVVKATFNVPSNTRCGTVKVQALTEEYPHLVGTTNYTAIGTLRRRTRTETTTKVVYRENQMSYVDPLAQTFEFETDQMLSSVGLYFDILDSNEEVTLQIRETDNGYPSNIVLAEKVVRQSDLTRSSNGSAETKISLLDPVYCQAKTQYAITVLTNSTKSSIFIQSLGEKDLITGEQVAQNPYIPGVMFTSSNALTWSAHQLENLKFNLYTNKFNEKSIVYFNPILAIDYDRIQILSDTSVPIDTSLEWEFSTNMGSTWLPVAINEDLELPQSINNVTIRAIIKAKINVSPAIAIDSLLLVGSKNMENSSYISRNVQTDMEFTNIKQVVDVFTPSGTGVVLYYSTDIHGNTWKPLTQQGEGKIKQVGGFTEYTYVATETTAIKNYRVKVAMTTNSTTIRPYVKNLKNVMK